MVSGNEAAAAKLPVFWNPLDIVAPETKTRPRAESVEAEAKREELCFESLASINSYS